MRCFSLFRTLRPLYCLITAAASAVLAFGLYNIHALANVTEGGVLGLILLLEHWLHISPALSGFVLNAACYGFGNEEEYRQADYRGIPPRK